MAPASAAKRPTAQSSERASIARLRRRLRDECPARGYAPPLAQKVAFRSLPLSEATLRGLEEGDGKQRQQNGGKRGGSGGKNGRNGGPNRNQRNAKGDNLSAKKQFWTMTDIQNACIPHALRGRDILGAARTGR